MRILIFTLLLTPLLSFSIPKDKQLHIGCGAIISATTIEGMHLLHVKKKTAIFVGIGTGILAGIAKEIYDKRFDRGDCLATSIGSIIGSITFVIKL